MNSNRTCTWFPSTVSCMSTSSPCRVVAPPTALKASNDRAAQATNSGGVAKRLEGEPRRARDPFVEHDGRAAAGVGDELRPARVGGDERRLGRRQRHVVVAERMGAVDAQRPGQANRNLDGADEVFDVARVRLALLHGARIGQHLARRRREIGEGPSRGHRIIGQRAPAGHPGGRRVVTRPQAREVVETAPGQRTAKVVGDPPVVNGHRVDVSCA